MILPKVDFDSLLAFFMLASTQTFSGAARALGTSNASVTRRIQQLEQQLRYPLIERRGKSSFALTAYGEELIDCIQELFEKTTEIEPRLERIDNVVAGPLRIAVHGGYSQHFIAPYLPEFLEKYPEIELTAFTYNSPLKIDLREADVVIRPWVTAKKGLIHKPLFNFTYGLYANKKYIQKWGAPSTIKDLKTHRLLGSYIPDLHFHGEVVNWHLKLGTTVPYAAYVSVYSNLLVHEMVKQGIVIGSCAQEFAASDPSSFTRILPDVEGPKMDVYFVYGKHFEKSKKVNAFYEFLREKCLKYLSE